MKNYKLSIATIASTSIAIIAFTSIAACKQKLSIQKTAYILGENDIVTVNAKNDIPEIRKASVLIATKLTSGSSRFCSGTMIKDSEQVLHIVTNHHCFSEEDDQGNVKRELLAQACVDTLIHFDFIEGNNRKSKSVKCLPGSLRSDPDIDLAVFKLQSPPPADHHELEFFTGDSSGRKAIIFHYPARTNGSALDSNNVSLPLGALTSNDCRVLGPFNNDEIALDSVLGASIRHTCDLDHGSSGSALIDLDSSKVLAINWGGVTIDQKDKGILRKDNTATRADIAQAFLNHQPYSISVANSSPKSKKSRTSAMGCSTHGIAHIYSESQANQREPENHQLAMSFLFIFGLPMLLSLKSAFSS
jgi:hypothetical protein